MSNYKLPPLIEDWILNMENPNTPDHIRENYCMMLDQVAESCSQAVKKFRNKKELVLPKKRRKNI